LAEGLDYCLRYRDVLGDNGREMARAYTWEAACEKVAGVYRRAAEPQEATAAIVIPSYNYSENVGRAIQGAVRQTYSLLKEIIVVDDGSTDDGATQRAVAEWTEKDNRVRYIRQDNAGVAAARNTGVAAANAKYVCCLDADDTLEPEFLSACVRALEKDNSLGIAYTGLRFILPDGKTGVSPWPAQWNFDDQLKRKNQVPTCCVYRKEMWACLGGYKSRYCPKGAGSEDAEFWTRAGAYGWKAAKVTEQPLFVYSWQSGRVSGNKEYSEPDWLAWHPWSRDDQHPFASYATPKRFAHAVRQYDEPTVSVVIPVGPGHEKRLEDALDSLEAQTFRRWEAIIVWDRDDEPAEWFVKAYPYVRWQFMEANAGAGAARNAGAKMARAPFLLFLDADDIMDPGCIEAMVAEWSEEPAIVYSDYVGKAFISDMRELDAKLQRNIVWRDESDGLTAMRYEAPDYDPEKAQQQPTGDPTKIYTWNLITSLVPKAWHDKVGGFDEDMPSWEDVDYFWRLAKEGYCFRRIPEPLVIYHFYTGGRRDWGHARHQQLFQYLVDKHERIEVKMCGSCGGRRPSPPSIKTAATANAPALALNNDDFKLATYMHPSKGQTHVYGAPLFRDRLDGVHMIQDRQTRLWRIHYGWRAGGDKFLVHTEDLRQSPHLFREEQVVKMPVVEHVPTPEPVSIVEQAVEEVVERKVPEPKRIDVKAVMKGNGAFDPQKLPGVTPKIAQTMKQRGITSLDDVLDLGEEGLQEVEGIGAVRAKAIYGRAMELAAHAS
jgi:glycosyltransferase involved in cell wall biosynthesis